MQTPAPSIRVTKTEAARRQLETAIRLWFTDGDPIAIHTLAAAAHQVIHDLATKTRGKGAVLRALPGVRPERLKAARKLITDAENFFKHADKDPAAFFDFQPATTPLFLLDAVLTYAELTGERPMSFRTLQMWLMIQQPEFVIDELQTQWRAQLQTLRPLIRSWSKRDFFTEYPASIARVEGGTIAGGR